MTTHTKKDLKKLEEDGRRRLSPTWQDRVLLALLQEAIRTRPDDEHEWSENDY